MTAVSLSGRDNRPRVDEKKWRGRKQSTSVPAGPTSVRDYPTIPSNYDPSHIGKKNTSCGSNRSWLPLPKTTPLKASIRIYNELERPSDQTTLLLIMH